MLLPPGAFNSQRNNSCTPCMPLFLFLIIIIIIIVITIFANNIFIYFT